MQHAKFEITKALALVVCQTDVQWPYFDNQIRVCLLFYQQRSNWLRLLHYRADFSQIDKIPASFQTNINLVFEDVAGSLHLTVPSMNRLIKPSLQHFQLCRFVLSLGIFA
jgi:hypothetical protein